MLACLLPGKLLDPTGRKSAQHSMFHRCGNRASQERPRGPLASPRTLMPEKQLCVWRGWLPAPSLAGCWFSRFLPSKIGPQKRMKNPFSLFTLDPYHLLTKGQATSGSFPSELGSSQSVQSCGLVPGTSLVTELTEEIFWGGGEGPF